MKRMVETMYAGNLAELQSIVNKLASCFDHNGALETVPCRLLWRREYCLVGFALVEETLTDGSKVYNVEVF